MAFVLVELIVHQQIGEDVVLDHLGGALAKVVQLKLAAGKQDIMPSVEQGEAVIERGHHLQRHAGGKLFTLINVDQILHRGKPRGND